jgi:2-amino-4-hydroxy-6-hydroxymethyldihydropteridine diphosphokinase
MTRAFVGIGSNINPEKNVREALRLLKEQVSLQAISTVYLTAPIGPTGQPPFYNCIIEIATRLQPQELKQAVLQRIEDVLGRKRKSNKFAPRTIDLDLLLYDDLTMTIDDHTLPDPDIVRRPFLAIALQELAPGLVLPGSNQSIDEAAAAMPRDGMQPLTTYTDLIRKEILHARK